MVNTAELKQIFPLPGNTFRHVVEGDGRYPRAMTPSDFVRYSLIPYIHKGNNYHGDVKMHLEPKYNWRTARKIR